MRSNSTISGAEARFKDIIRLLWGTGTLPKLNYNPFAESLASEVRKPSVFFPESLRRLLLWELDLRSEKGSVFIHEPHSERNRSQAFGRGAAPIAEDGSGRPAGGRH